MTSNSGLNQAWRGWWVLVVIVMTTGCSLKSYAIDTIGDALSSGDSVYETDDDLVLVGDALPFGLKLAESLLAQSPGHRGLLLTVARGFALYSYAYVDYAATVSAEDDIDRAREPRARARRLYLRALRYAIRGLERSYPGIGYALVLDPRGTVQRISIKTRAEDIGFMYWAAASLGLAIAVSPGDAALLARLPEVHALLDRALEIDEAWDEGALHEFKVVLAGAVPGTPDIPLIKRHYDRAVELSHGMRGSIHLAYAEAVSVPSQNGAEFHSLIRRALEVNPDNHQANRLVNLLAHRRALWLAARADQLILDDEPLAAQEETTP